MTTELQALIGEAYESNVSWQVLRSLTDIGNRMAGQNGEQAGVNVLKEWFIEFGFRDISTSTFEVPGWWRDSSSLTTTGEREQAYSAQHELIALPGSPGATVTGEVVDLGTGIPENYESTDVDSRIVLVSTETPEDYGRWVHRTEKYSLAIEHGADGFLFQNEIPGCLPLTGSVGWESEASIPAVGLSREVGSELKTACAKGTLEASLEVDAQRKPSTSQNLSAKIGPDTESEILLTAHVDAHDIAAGATDNGVGCAVVTEVARLLDKYATLETSIRVAIFGSEEIGLLGSEHWASECDIQNIECILNVDGNGEWEDLTTSSVFS